MIDIWSIYDSFRINCILGIFRRGVIGNNWHIWPAHCRNWRFMWSRLYTPIFVFCEFRVFSTRVLWCIMVYFGLLYGILWHFLPRIWLFMTSSRVLWFLWVLSTLVLWAFMGCLVKKDHKIKSENKIKKGMGIQLKCDYCSGPISGKTHVFKFANFERFFCCTECRAAYKKKYSGKIEALTKRHHNINYSW